jgi:hypothetical protein
MMQRRDPGPGSRTVGSGGMTLSSRQKSESTWQFQKIAKCDTLPYTSRGHQ